MNDIQACWDRYFPSLAATDDAGMRTLRSQARLLTLEPGQPVFHAGDACSNYLLVLEGQVRVQMTGEGGREMILYRVGSGQSCVLTTSCLIANDRYPAEAFADTPVRAFALSRADFETALDASAVFRRFVFANLGNRLAEVIARMDAVAFQPIERRLATLLLSRASAGPMLQATHQDLAVELGTAREVVSRNLKRLESRGLVRLGRSSVEIVDADRLRTLAGSTV